MWVGGAVLLYLAGLATPASAQFQLPSGLTVTYQTEYSYGESQVGAATEDSEPIFENWLNADYTFDDNDGGSDPGAYGIALAGRYAWTERLGTALRLEYVADDRAAFGFGDEADLWSVTATVDYSLTERLILKGEIRHDQGQIDKSPDHLFIDDGDRLPGVYTDQDQTMIGAQVIYNF